MSIRRNRIISGFFSFVMVMTMVVGVFPPIKVSAATGQVTISNPDNNEKFQVGEEIYVSWERTPATASYYQFVVKQLYGTPKYVVGADESGKVILNEQIAEKGISQYVSTKFDTSNFVADCWYKIYVKGWNSDGSVCSEADARWIYLVSEDQETLSAEFPDGSNRIKISGDGYDENAVVTQIYIDASTNWTASVDEDWVTLSRYKGTTSNTNILVYAENNDSLKSRSAYITIVCGELEVELRLTQSGRSLTASELCENDAKELEINYAVGDDEGHVTQDIVLPTEGLSNGSSVKWESSDTNIIANDGQVTRPTEDTEVILTAELLNYVNGKYGSYTKKFYLTVLGTGTVQDTISINPNWDELTANVSGGAGTTFTVTSSSTWEVTSNVNWISFNRESGESGTSFTPTIASNANEYREGIITVTCGDASIEIFVQQEGTTTEPEKIPCVTSLSVNPTEGTLNTTYTFTAKAENTDTVVFYVSGYKIGEVTSTSETFKCTYNKFTSGGDRVVYAYPCDEYGNEIKTSGSYQTEEFTITVGGTLSPVQISTASYQSIDVNTSFAVGWTDTASVPNDVSYNIYVWYDSKQVGDVMNTSSHSITIPSSYFTKEGRYIIGIYAISDTWTASSGVSIAVNATVNTPYIENFAISPNAVSLGGTVGLSGMVYGNGSDIAEIIIKITNNSDGTGGVYRTLYPGSNKLDMADTSAINTSDAIFTTPGTYSVKLYALNEGAVNEVLLGQKTLQLVADTKITLNTPVLGGTSTISYGDDYTVSWNYDGSVDYYLIGISGLTYSKTVDASNSSYTIPFSVFKQYLGSSGSNFTVYVTAMSNSDTYLPSAKESKTVYVSGDASEKAVIKSVTLPGRDQNEVTAGEIVTFEVVTSTDVEAIRMKDGAGTFIVNTWNSGYTDSGSNRIWTVKQKVSYAGSSDADYVNRSLTFYSMIGNTEYNKCNVTFICVKDAVVGAFDITKPVNGSEQQSEKSLTITWTTPDTGVDYYVVDITHNGVRIDEDVFPYEVRNGNSYTLDGSYLIRDNNAWNVQVTGCKAGMADTSDSIRFVLKCQHERLGTAVEKYLSYTNTGSSSTHSVKTEKTYPCPECGMTNAKTETGTKAVNHNYITLDEGGKVCNQCWYVNSNGSYDIQYDMSLVTTNSNGRENVYANVGADGNPVNAQSSRYVEVGDSITVWGVLGNSYLIEYPTSSGTHKGFIRIDHIDMPKTPDIQIEQTANQIYVQSMYDEVYGNPNSISQSLKGLGNTRMQSFDIFLNEYGIAHFYCQYWSEEYSSLDQIQRNAFSGKSLIMNNIQRLCNPDAYVAKLEYEILHSIICEIPPSYDSDLKDKSFLIGASYVDKANTIKDFCNNAKAIYKFDETSVHYSEDYILTRIRKLKTIDIDVDFKIVEESFLDSFKSTMIGLGLDYVFEALRAYNNYQKFAIAAELEYFEALRELCGNDSNMVNTINKLEGDYLNSVAAFSNNLFDFLSEKMAEASIDMVLKFVFGTLFLKVKVVEKVIEFCLKAIGTVTGLTDIANAKEIITLYGWLLYSTKYSLANELMKYDGTVGHADKIASFYQVYRGMQIYFNNLVVKVVESEYEFDATIEDSRVAQLQEEALWVKQHDISQWQFNPFAYDRYGNLVIKPDTANLEKNYYMNILLNGYPYSYPENFDGVMENWLQLTAYDQQTVVSMVDMMQEFNKSNVNKMYLMHFITEDNRGNIVENSNGNVSMYHQFDYYSVMYVNEDGTGLYFTRPYMYVDAFGKTKMPGYTTCYTFLTKKQVSQLLAGNIPDQSTYFTVDNSAYGEIAKFINWQYSSYLAEAIEFDISQEQFYSSLNLYLGEKYCRYSNNPIFIDELVDATFGITMGAWHDFRISWTFDDIVEKSGRGKIITTRYH